MKPKILFKGFEDDVWISSLPILKKMPEGGNSKKQKKYLN